MKHLLLSASLLLMTGNLTAQLHVSPNTFSSTDSYIYANDVVLYVEEGIDLQVNNNNPQTQASIYLRGDAQLIQGDKPVSQNSGNGYISVWQRGTTNAFDYNYWASPVGVPNGSTGNTNFGISSIFDVQNDGSDNTHRTHSLQQTATNNLNGEPSDVTDPTLGNLRVSQRWIYTMRAQSGYANWIFIGNSNNLQTGEGFTMKGTGTPAQVGNTHNQLYDFRGRPNDGNITVAVAGTPSEFQETLTGNPYPSALDMAAFLNAPANSAIEATAYYWESDPSVNSHYIAEYVGGYGAWQPNGGPNVPGIGDIGQYALPVFIRYDGAGNPLPGDVGTGTLVQRRFAPIGQGFMVRGISNGVATFTNDMRLQAGQGAANYSEFKSGGNGGATLSSVASVANPIPDIPDEPQYVYPTLRLHVEINNLYVRDMVMIFSAETTKGADRGWDSKHPLLISDGDAFWKLEDETDPYVIQSRPYDHYDMIPLGLRVRNGKTSFKIKVAEMHSFNMLARQSGTATSMYLYDQQNNIYQNLSPNHDAVIDHSGSAGTIEDRYFIVFRRGITDEAIVSKQNEVTVNFFQNNTLAKLEVSNSDVLDIKNASVYDMRGRLVINENNLGKVPKFSFSTQHLSSGVYVVKLTTAEAGIIDYKITVHNR